MKNQLNCKSCLTQVKAKKEYKDEDKCNLREEKK